MYRKFSLRLTCECNLKGSVELCCAGSQSLVYVTGSYCYSLLVRLSEALTPGTRERCPSHRNPQSSSIKENKKNCAQACTGIPERRGRSYFSCHITIFSYMANKKVINTLNCCKYLQRAHLKQDNVDFWFQTGHRHRSPG